MLTVEKLAQPKDSEGKIIGKTAPQGDSERNRRKTAALSAKINRQGCLSRLITIFHNF